MTVGGPAAPVRPTVQHDIDWSPLAHGGVVWTPAEHRQPIVDEATALRILRCTAASFRALRDLGLTPQDTPDGPRYDVNDVRNAALYSRSGRTEVEVAMGSILSFLRGSERDLFAERRWSYSMTAATAGSAQQCLLHPLAPEAFGGVALSLDVDGAAPSRVDARVPVPFGVPLRGTVVTRGYPDPVVSPVIRAATDELVASGVRWQYLSAGLKRDAHAAFALGIGNCDTLSTVLADRLTATGYRPEIYRGWIVGITEVPHSWIEVPDDDQRVKVVDPSLLLLATHSSLGSPNFAANAFGARLSRIAPTRCPLAEPVGTTDTGEACDVQFSCRPLRAAPASTKGDHQ